MSIVLESVGYTYMPNTPFERIGVKDVNLTIEKGEFVAVIGHTGSGKSTLMQHLNGLLKPQVGMVSVDGIDINAKGNGVKAAVQKVGMVFQYPEHQLFEETVYNDIAFGPRNMGIVEDEVEKRVRSAMEFVNLDFDAYKDRSPFQLSGGQMRRVAIAGVIALEPEYLVLDEPTAGLDPFNRDAILDKIKELHDKAKIGIVLVSHSMDDVAKLADRIIVMQHGSVIMDNKPMIIFQENDKLTEIGLDLPQTVKLIKTLQQQGININQQVLTVDKAAEAIYNAVRRK